MMNFVIIIIICNIIFFIYAIVTKGCVVFMVWFISDFPISLQDGEGIAKLWIFVVYALLL